MVAIFFVIGMFMTFSIGFVGLIRGRVQLSGSNVIEGGAARAIGVGCIILGLVMGILALAFQKGWI